MTIERLPISIQGPDQLQASIDELRAIAGLLVQAERRSVTDGVEQRTAVTAASQTLLNLLTEQQRAAAAPIDRLADQLENLLAAAQTIYITIAAAPPSALRAALTDWFRSSVQPTVLLTFRVDAGLGGGMTVRTLNHIYDFSFRTSLLADSSNFIKVLERV